MTKFKVPVSQVEKRKKTIPLKKEYRDELQKNRKEKIQFSFSLLELNHKYFNLGTTCNKWSQSLMVTMQELSNISKVDLLSGRYEDRFRPHGHDWEKLKESFNLDDLEQLETRQISLGAGSGRIHGVFIGNVFFLIWLDPKHYLYHNKKFGPIELRDPPETCCEEYKKKLESESLRYESKIDELESELELYKEQLDSI